MTSELMAPAVAKHPAQGVRRHIITPEYPPQPGGVSDYIEQLSRYLVEAGDEVHVWCPPVSSRAMATGGVQVHRDLGGVTPEDLAAIGEQLDRFPAPRRLLVQWVPHGYGRRSMNVPFCLWVWRRAKQHGDLVELMVHEPFLTFERSWRQCGAALIHRLMTVILIQSATRVWFSTLQFLDLWKPYAMGRKIPFQWLPIPSNIRVSDDATASQSIRRQYVPDGALLIGHFGTYGSLLVSVLEPILAVMARELPNQPVLLMGRGSEEFRSRLIDEHPGWKKNLYATGGLSPEELSCHLRACDLLIQPYPDGASARRSSLMAGISHAKAIVTTTSDATEPIWRDSAAVGLVPAGDAQGFVKLLGQILQDPAERVRLSESALRLYREHFDVPHIVATLRGRASEEMACVS